MRSLPPEKIDGARPYAGAAGEVIGRDSDGILVKSGDTFLRLTRWAPVHPWMPRSAPPRFRMRCADSGLGAT